jgi:hypothetical protein
MNIYLVTRTDYVDYEEFKAAVVIAASVEQASTWDPNVFTTGFPHPPNGWSADHLTVTLIGVAPSSSSPRVVLISDRAY